MYQQPGPTTSPKKNWYFIMATIKKIYINEGGKGIGPCLAGYDASQPAAGRCFCAGRYKITALRARAGGQTVPYRVV